MSYPGCCFVNDFVRCDARPPLCGLKESGYGRELSRHGNHEFVNARTVWVRWRACAASGGRAGLGLR